MSGHQLEYQRFPPPRRRPTWAKVFGGAMIGAGSLVTGFFLLYALMVTQLDINVDEARRWFWQSIGLSLIGVVIIVGGALILVVTIREGEAPAEPRNA